MKFKSGDKVMVITGKDKGKTGAIIQIFRKENAVVVDGLNIRHKHIKPQKQGEKGQKISFSAPMNASNVALLDPKDAKKATRIGYKLNDKGVKVRFAKKSGQVID